MRFANTREAPGYLAGIVDMRGAQESLAGSRAVVSTPGWCVRRARARAAMRRSALGARVRASCVSSYRTYGARRVWHDLLAEGLSCGLHRVERLMRAQGLKARPRRRGLSKDKGQRSVIAGNVLDRQFTAEGPNQKWVADFTYIWTAEGWLYVAAVIDPGLRRGRLCSHAVSSAGP